MARSSWFCQRDSSGSSWDPPVGRGSLWSMPFVARQTATSLRRLSLRLPSSGAWQLGSASAKAVPDLMRLGKVGDELATLGEIASPDWMILQPCRDAGNPWQWPIVLVGEGREPQSRTAAMSRAVDRSCPFAASWRWR